MAPAAAAAPQDRPEHEHIVVDESVRVSVRRSPHYGRFLAVGIGAGLLLAVIATAVTVSSGSTYLEADAAGTIRAFGVFSVIFIGTGLAISGIAAIVADRMMARRHRVARMAHQVTIVDDLASPLRDEPLRWTSEDD